LETGKFLHELSVVMWDPLVFFSSHEREDKHGNKHSVTIINYMVHISIFSITDKIVSKRW